MTNLKARSRPDEQLMMGSLPERTLNQLASVQLRQCFSDGEVVHQRGESGDGLSIILSGAVKMGNYGRDGRYFLSKLLFPGESFGEFVVFANLPRTHTAEAVGETELGYISSEKLNKVLLQSPTIAYDLLVSLSTRLHQSLEAIDDLKRLPLAARLAKLLLIMANETNNTSYVAVSQEQIAAQLGVSRISVSKSLKQLTKLGFIKPGYHTVHILDAKNLAKWLEQQSQTLSLS
ncbi:Crp/Fnr family transcriptional regulator [Thalassotalea euphylliae]|uniref:Crp/Fnr family transcriptional regulator n=2 Tax=Thalassotalea euphylliae TaxID=1655234 RepID=A0A3E0TY44_9GAMM|nr:Crp/Fnr family transcriptional regulator [Thalassotalea euphylliae]